MMSITLEPAAGRLRKLINNPDHSSLVAFLFTYHQHILGEQVSEVPTTYTSHENASCIDLKLT